MSCAPFGAPELLQLDSAAGLLELLLHVLGLGLGDALLHGLGRAVHQILRLLQAEARQLANDLDDLDLLVSGALENDGELVLLRRGSRATRSRGARTDRSHRHRS